MALSPCLSCRRHVRVDELSCPFCGARNQAPVAAPPLTVTKLTRAALFAGATLLAPACSTGKSDKSVEPVTDPAPTRPADAAVPTPAVADAGAVPVVDASPPDAAPEKKKIKKKRKKKKEVKKEVPLEPPPDSDPPYGAPPSPDDRLV